MDATTTARPEVDLDIFEFRKTIRDAHGTDGFAQAVSDHVEHEHKGNPDATRDEVRAECHRVASDKAYECRESATRAMAQIHELEERLQNLRYEHRCESNLAAIWGAAARELETK